MRMAIGLCWHAASRLSEDYYISNYKSKENGGNIATIQK